MARVLRQIDDEELERPFNKSQFVRLIRYMLPYKKQMIGSLILMVLASICSLGQPFLMSRALGVLEKIDGATWKNLTLLIVDVYKRQMYISPGAPTPASARQGIISSR